MGEVVATTPTSSPVAGRQRSFVSGVIERPARNRISVVVSTFLVAVFVATAVITRFVDVSIFAGALVQKNILPSNKASETSVNVMANSTNQTCPHYFRWIHEDLKPWKKTGITREMVEKARGSAHFRLIIVDGRLFMEKYDFVFQTRDVFTVWGIVQLLKLYPGKLPDLELMFMCHDRPGIRKGDFRGNDSASVLPLFHYCGDDSTFDIVFPDWSFWGWPEINVKPWETLKREMQEGNERTKWDDREPFAQWKGNLYTGGRQRIARCNVTHDRDWNARIYNLDWGREIQQGFKNTDLASQCTHRYKIYVEGNAWSVSEKYILACDSMSLLVDPHYYDFFTRSLLPTVHYWPINERDSCKSIKYAVDWGNKNIKRAQEIGKAGSRFIQEELQMKYVYDYMFHLLAEYAKLFRYRPAVTKNAVEVCTCCFGTGLVKEYKEESMVKGPSDTSPCSMPPPFDPRALRAWHDKKLNLFKQVRAGEARGKV